MSHFEATVKQLRSAVMDQLGDDGVVDVVTFIQITDLGFDAEAFIQTCLEEMI